jgi:hypothetical protein
MLVIKLLKSEVISGTASVASAVASVGSFELSSESIEILVNDGTNLYYASNDSPLTISIIKPTFVSFDESISPSASPDNFDIITGAAAVGATIISNTFAHVVW